MGPLNNPGLAFSTGLIREVGSCERLASTQSSHQSKQFAATVPDREKHHKECGGEPFEVDCGGGQERLNTHIVEATTDCPREAMPSLCFTMDSFRTPAVAPVKAPFLLAPSLAAPTCTQYCRVVVDDDNGLRDARGRQANFGKITPRTIPGFGCKEPALPYLGLVRAQYFTSRAFNDVVFGVVPEAP